MSQITEEDCVHASFVVVTCADLHNNNNNNSDDEDDDDDGFKQSRCDMKGNSIILPDCVS